MTEQMESKMYHLFARKGELITKIEVLQSELRRANELIEKAAQNIQSMTTEQASQEQTSKDENAKSESS